MMRVLLSRPAAADLAGHLTYIAGENPAAAARYADKAAQAMEVLSIFPLAGMVIGDRRKYVIPGTSLILVYRLKGDVLEITRCFDGRTNWNRPQRR